MCHDDHTLSFEDFCEAFEFRNKVRTTLSKTHTGEDNFGEHWFDASKAIASCIQNRENWLIVDDAPPYDAYRTVVRSFILPSEHGDYPFHSSSQQTDND
ncbi:hypothetical protein P8452_51530 [Trifolium repens]|nr:hypothetical protein P8452_51530 [Trifolium repens]